MKPNLLLSFSSAHSQTTATLIASLLLLTGCIAVPVPARKQESALPAKTQTQSSFIKTGVTTRAEIIERLGDDYRSSPRVPALAYSWEKGNLNWMLVVITPHVGAAGEFESTHWRGLFLLFDSNNVVQKVQFVRLSQRKSLDQQLEKWAERTRTSARQPRAESHAATGS